jgi:hypothetical protein
MPCGQTFERDAPAIWIQAKLSTIVREGSFRSKCFSWFGPCAAIKDFFFSVLKTLQAYQVSLWTRASAKRKIRNMSLTPVTVFKRLTVLLAAAYVYSSLLLCAQTPAPPNEASRTDTIESQSGNMNPTRSIENHSKSGNRTIDTRSLQRRGASGDFEPYQDIETETVQVNSTTARTTTRTFGRDSNGAKTLVQVTEEEKRTSPAGDASVVRSISNPDANGRLQLIQRQIEETKKTGMDTEETKTTVMLPGGNGDLAPAVRMQERHRKAADGTIETQKTTLLPDGNGNWQVGEMQRSTTRQDGKNRSTEETTSRSDLDGHLGEVSRTVSKESESGPGDTKSTVETYSVDVPGSARDGDLHSVQRITTRQRTGASGGKTIQQVEQPVPGDLESVMRVTTVTVDTATSGSSGTHSTRTIQASDANNSAVMVDTAKTGKSPAVQVQIAPAEKPK